MLNNMDLFLYNVHQLALDKIIKFHFVLAAEITSLVLIFNLLNIIDNSFRRAIFKSLWVFSIIFAASATTILLTLYVPATIISL